MSNRVSGLLDRVRKPEYTGDNRCMPCTVLNLVLALVVTAAVAVFAAELAAAVCGLSVLAIALRGYLVPGTPALTERFLPESVLARFDAHPAEPETWETIEKHEEHRRNAVDPEQFLVDVGAVTVDGDERRWTDALADDVTRRERELRGSPVDRDAIAAVFDADPDAVTFEDREYPAISIDHRIRKWPSDAALVADVAGHQALDRLTDRWTDVPIEQRLDMLASLRAFHDTCPSCDGALRRSADTVESCCRTFEVVALICEDCGDHLLELDPSSAKGRKLTRR